MPDLRRLCVEAGARALGEWHYGVPRIAEKYHDEHAREVAAVLDAILPVLTEAVEGKRQQDEWIGDESERVLNISARAINATLDAVLALLADVQGER